MNSEISIFSLISEASFLVKLVMLLLLSLSIASWAIIIERIIYFKNLHLNIKHFEAKFWSGIDLNKLYGEIDAKPYSQGTHIIFKSGFKEFLHLHRSGYRTTNEVISGTNKAMQLSLNKEISGLEKYLPFLATVGSVSPYIGLFGTVWGIMNAFIALGQTNATMTISLVAPAIAEALIATAIGLFAAIPAVIAFNNFSHFILKSEGKFINFVEEFESILEKQFKNSRD